MHVVNAKAEAVAQHDSGANVGSNHALFNDTVGRAALLGDDLQHFAFFAQDKAVVRAIFKYQSVLVAPGITHVTHALEQGDLLCNVVTWRLPAGNAFQPVGHFVINQFGF
ncbi:hypothetical protein D3C80_1361930 [compost metagenome]